MSRKIRLIFLRHAEPQATGAAKFHAPLTESGRQDAKTIAEFLAIDGAIRAVYTSSLPRARETAELISTRLGVPLKVIPELQEIHLGEWEGKTPDDIRRESPKLVDTFTLDPERFTIPGGEKLSVFLRRIRGALREVQSDLGSGTAVIVAHTVSIAFMLCELLLKDPREFTNYMPSHYCSMSILSSATGSLTYKREHFDMRVSRTFLRQSKDRTYAFMGVSFAIAFASFVAVLQSISTPSETDPRTLCLGISLLAYLSSTFAVFEQVTPPG